jgi:hypothetical protein
MITIKTKINFDKGILKKIDKINELAAEASTKPVEQDAKMYCPVGDTEMTRKSIKSDVKNGVGRVLGSGAMEYIEFGTDYIAGGAVKEWSMGDSPILDWPAKRKDNAYREKMPPMRSALYENRKKCTKIFNTVYEELL